MQPRRSGHPLLMAFAIAALVACGDRPAPRPADSAAETTQVDAAAARAADWIPELGTLLLVPSDSDNTAVVLFPDEPTAALMASNVTLITPGGDSATVRMTAAPPDSLQCGDVPRVRIDDAGALSWSAGTSRRSASWLRMDSIEAMPSADSARLAADLARLASTLPATPESRFTGLPFSVLSARRFDASGRRFVAAHLVRRLNQEASPLEEHTFILVDRPSAGGPFAIAHHDRSEGTEDTAERYGVLAAIAVNGSPMLLRERYRESRTVYEVLARDSSTGRWRTRWVRELDC